MAARKQVSFEDEERLPIPSVTRSSGDLQPSCQPLKQAARPKLTLNLRPADPTSFLSSPYDIQPHSHVRFNDQSVAFGLEKAAASQQPIRTRIPSPNLQSVTRPYLPPALTTTQRPSLGRKTDSIDAFHLKLELPYRKSDSDLPHRQSDLPHRKLDLTHRKSDLPHGRQIRPSLTREPNDVDITYLQSIKNHQVDYWRHFFERPDRPRPGEISISEIRQLLRNPLFIKDMDNHTKEVLQMKCSEPERQNMMYQELVDLTCLGFVEQPYVHIGVSADLHFIYADYLFHLCRCFISFALIILQMSNKRTPSFRIAVDGESKERLECLSRNNKTTFFQVMVRAVARNFLTDDVERQYYADRYNCCPPPVFVPVITLVEIGLFAYYCVDNGNINYSGPVPVESYLIYRPDKRIEFWRFICYTFIHAGWIHLIFNMIVQIVVGIPLEMIHGCLRTGMVYMSGVLAGSLGTSIFDMEAYLVGASGGVYALLAAHLANIVLNYSNMELGILKLASVLIIASADVGFAIWGRYSVQDTEAPVGYTAHLMGALAGLTIGLVVLKNFEQKLHDQYIWWIALAIYLGCMVFAICWNILYY